MEKNSNEGNILLNEVTTVIRKIDTAPTYRQMSNKKNEAIIKSCETWMETSQWALWCLTFGCSYEGARRTFSCMVPVVHKQKDLKAA